jgi:hypothetical protein
LSVEELDRLIESKAAATLSGLRVVDLRGEPVWVASAEVEAHPRQEQTHIWRYATLNKLMEDYSGKVHVLSAGGKLLTENYSLFDLDLAAHLVSMNRPQGSMPNRSCTEMLGHQSYTGKRGSNALQVHPLYGAECPEQHDYWNQDFKNTHARIALAPLTNSLSAEAKQIGQALHRDHLRFINGFLPRSRNCLMDFMCFLRIVTFGILGTYLAFANSFHVDKNDKFSPRRQRELLRVLDQLKSGVPSSAIRHNGVKARPKIDLTEIKYLRSWHQRFGYFDIATSCGYADMGTPPENSELFQYFVMDSLGIALRLGKGVVHSFFASMASHCTCLAILVVNGRVYLKSDSYTLLAWGNGSGKIVKDKISTQVKKRLQRRRRNRDELY